MKTMQLDYIHDLGLMMFIAVEERLLFFFKRKRTFNGKKPVEHGAWSWVEMRKFGVRSVTLDTHLQLTQWANDKRYREVFAKQRGAARGIEWPDPPPRVKFAKVANADADTLREFLE